ncbi:hypothetical protein LBMAG42_27530 [Deltaproteobacteria bacterium]|nr:hypothetical protein LBMAG42_27530 [Deltaproteobacteria bacterium]
MWLPPFMLLAGLFTLVCASRDYDWFMNHRKARLFVSIFGRTGARIFYMGLGVALIVFSAITFLGGPT